MKRALSFAVAGAWVILWTGCTVGPKYQRPSAPTPPAYKEPPPAGYKEWKQATPLEGFMRGKWWEIYKDPALNALEEQVALSNQNVLMAEAQFREARAAIKVARSNLFPTLTAGPSASFSQGSSRVGAGTVSSTGTVTNGGATGVQQFYTLPFDLTWQLDLWGSIRRTAAAAANTAQASAAQLENARLSYQSELAQDYFSMHGLDSQEQLLANNVKLYAEYVDLTRFQFQHGTASEANIALAQTQLESTRAQMIGIGVQRAQYEHAIAILEGKPPAELTIPRTPWTTPPPAVPAGVPSELLERRPDIAAAERQMAAANEQIGVAKAAYYPTLTLSGAAGFEGSSIARWFSWPSRFWALGPQLAETLLDFGRRRGAVQESQAAYDSAVANYRQTVLTAFEQVENNLAALRILEEQAGAEERAVNAARASLDITTDQFRYGVSDYLQVLTAQTALLSNQVAAAGILTSRMVANVMLIEALGGGWNTSELPSPQQLRSANPASAQQR